MNKVFILAIGFLPNIGGLETHLKDLIDELIKKKWQVVVLTYQPLHTPILGKWIEYSDSLTIYRLPSLRGLFYKLLKFPILEFIFLEPLIFLFTPIILLLNPGTTVINGQGVIAGFAGAFWSKVFRKRYIVSVQSVYHFPKTGLYREIAKWIFESAKKVIAISKQAKNDIKSLGVKENKIIVYTNWENLDNYQPVDKAKAKKQIKFENKFIVSFFGRLVEEKGIRVLLDAIPRINNQITFLIYGEGPLKEEVQRAAKQTKNIDYMGIISPKDLSIHYSAADIVVMPSLSEEGFGRVASGALLCSTPVVASNKGALPDVVIETVGKVVEPTSANFTKAINELYNDKVKLKMYSLNARKYAMDKFGPKNADKIIRVLSN